MTLLSKKTRLRILAAALTALTLLCVLFSVLLSDTVRVASMYTTVREPEAKKFIKWAEFSVPENALADALSIMTADKDRQTDWIELLSLAAVKYSGIWKRYRRADLADFQKGGEAVEKLRASKYYAYYYEVYTAVLGEFAGAYRQRIDGEDVDKYGLKAFSPVARGYAYSHYDDFGNSRSYGYKRRHLGNDIMGRIGTPIVAVESGIVEELGWNQYGGWRIGIRSFDKKRYYYYAHLRKNHPYNPDVIKGGIVVAGSVIGYLGMTGYSSKENTNNINVPHLHFGMQLIFDESQKDGNGEIWINVYNLVKLLTRNRAPVTYDEDSKNYYAKNDIVYI